jgi:AraC-like DNA-binding protein
LSNNLIEIKSNDLRKHNTKLRYVSRARYEDDWYSIMHMHPFTELFYIVEGTGLFKIKDETIHVKKDDLIIVNAYVLHTESSKNSMPLEYIVLGIDGISLTVDSTNSYIIHNYYKYKQEILFYVYNILKEAQRQEENYQLVCENLLEILIINLKRRIKSNIILTSQKKMNTECTFIKKYIDVHYASNLTLDSLASVAYMNKFYLVHEFKKYNGISPIEYLIEKRISVSKLLLKTTQYSIEQIAGIVGFNSQSYFNQIFKKKTGTTPTKYRKTHTNK